MPVFILEILQSTLSTDKSHSVCGVGRGIRVKLKSMDGPSPVFQERHKKICFISCYILSHPRELSKIMPI